MSIDLPLDKMTLADKLATMEAIWADLSKRPTICHPLNGTKKSWRTVVAKLRKAS